MARSRKRPPRTRPDKPITADVLRKLLQEKVSLTNNLKLPCNAELEEFASILEHWRRTFRNEQILRTREKLQKNALAAVKTLHRAVLALGDHDHANYVAAVKDNAPEGVQRELDARRAASLDVLRAVVAVSNLPALHTAPLSYGATGWKFLAAALPGDFANAMKPKNPRFAPGISNAGPLPRFIAAIVPLITGERPTVASVATQLKKVRRAHGHDR